jgi:hypothetical protein
MVLLALCATAVCFFTFVYWPALPDALESLIFVQPAPEPTQADLPPDVQNDAPPIRQPPILLAARAALDDDTPVIGLLAGGRARAYLVEAFERGPGSHVVDDVLGGVSVSVTHCDISGCTRVFTGADSGRPLELSQGGIRDYSMVLKADGRLYRQESCEPLDAEGPRFPFAAYPSQVTVWGIWRKAHPDTDVYMGSVDEAAPAEVQTNRKPPPS